MFAGKALRCDCGYDVRADDDAFVEAIRRHAREVHGIEFSVELALEVARRARQVPSEHDELELEHNRVIRKEKSQEGTEREGGDVHSDR
jgi:predicted small metal-binding protein